MAFNRYAQLRDQFVRACPPSQFATVILRDSQSNYVPIPISERLVQCIWFDQRVAAGLRTTDGRSVRVVFAGWWNLEAGPDFHRAIVQVGNTALRTGAVEVHLRADDWYHHRHHHDSRYNDVILHVVLWRAGSDQMPMTAGNQLVPQVVLEEQLAAPLEQLHDEIDLDAYPHNVGQHAGRCAEVLAQLPPATIQTILDEAGDERFATKTRRFRRWLHRAGADQAFYEGWMEALGYKANKRGFRLLAQRVPLAELAQLPAAVRPAVLFGVAGFLPVTAGRDPHVRKLWAAWWKRRPAFADRILSADTWQARGLRPANHPHRRLGAAVALLAAHPRLLADTLAALEHGTDPADSFAGLRDEYWNRHFTLGGKTQRQVTELLGEARVRELVANVVLPFAAACSQEQDRAQLAANVKTAYAALRPAPSNSVLRLAAQQLFGPPPAGQKLVNTTRRQQGLLQVFQDFCLNDKSACQQCQFPALARQWAAHTTAAGAP